MHESEIWALEAVKLLSNKNLNYLLDLFEEDAIVYEPFSREGMLNGIAEIAPFLKIVCNNPVFLFSKESTKIAYMKRLPGDGSKVQVTTKHPNDCQLEFEFGESKTTVKGKETRKIKKLRIQT